ncbi:MAG: aminotransferase class I/II-fold pyridoxal phosphate-dependent enzyme [Clostridia bacterium]|nr:aminotransferase class I/II-fold pyridoxal phosphate-dependent enzyme [Clostridia bacterium]
MRLNKTVANLKPSGIREFFDIVSTMPEALSLGVGEPDFVTPWPIRNAAIKSIQKGYTAYTSNKGLLELRMEISRYLEDRFAIKYSANDEIIVTNGASEAIDLALRALVEPGDGVLVPSPSYVSYSPVIQICGGHSIPVRCSAETMFKLTPEALEEAAKKGGKTLIISYPNNPTGAIMTRPELEALVPIIKKYDLMLVSDEIYAELTYPSKHVSVASINDLKDRTILVGGFSKAFAMTGWRLGFACAPKDALDAMFKTHQYAALCAPTVSQYAGLAALRDGREDDYSAVSEMKEEYDQRRRYLVSELRKLGFKIYEPQGAFYIFADVSCSGMNGNEFAHKLLKAEKVAVVPGNAFGEECENFVRISYATSLKVLTQAMDRIAHFLSSN